MNDESLKLLRESLDIFEKGEYHYNSGGADWYSCSACGAVSEYKFGDTSLIEHSKNCLVGRLRTFLHKNKKE